MTRRRARAAFCARRRLADAECSKASVLFGVAKRAATPKGENYEEKMLNYRLVCNEQWAKMTRGRREEDMA